MPPAFATTTASGERIGSVAPSASTRIASVVSRPSGVVWRTSSGTAHLVSSSGRDGEYRRCENRSVPSSAMFTEMSG